MDNRATLKYEPPAQGVERFCLLALEGPEKGKVFEIPYLQERVLLGTSPTCMIQLTDPHISRRHAALATGDSWLELYDLGSSNGTSVNGVRVVECRLRGGETLHLGDSIFRVEAQGARTESAFPQIVQFGRFLGQSKAIRRVFELAKSLAASDVPVVIEGESGVGKELLAECIHEASARKEGPFVVFDPLADAPESLPRNLFGADANTGAPSVGALEQAHKGTLLIDGPADMPLDVQRKLLRALDKKESKRIGAEQTQSFDVRVIVASTDDLDRAVEQGRLREDLFFRLGSARIEIPPLRRRREDIAMLTEHFFKLAASAAQADEHAPAEVVARYELRAWPGNVRELQSAVAAHLAAGDWQRDDLLDSSGVVDSFAATLALDLSLPQAKQRVLAGLEAAFVQRLLAKHGGNVSRAAAASGVAHRYFQVLKARHRK
jgi:two-component system, NtrC family, response regulator HydG